MSKTIKQIADELGVSKQAVQKRLAREPLYTCLQPYISTNGNTKYIDDVGEIMIKTAFCSTDIDTSATMSIDTSATMSIDTSTTTENRIFQLLQDNLTILQEQLKEKDKQLEDKSKQIKHLNSELAEERKHSREQADKLAILADTSQKLHAGTIKQLEGGAVHADEQATAKKSDETKSSKGFIKRIFKK